VSSPADKARRKEVMSSFHPSILFFTVLLYSELQTLTPRASTALDLFPLPRFIRQKQIGGGALHQLPNESSA